MMMMIRDANAIVKWVMQRTGGVLSEETFWMETIRSPGLVQLAPDHPLHVFATRYLMSSAHWAEPPPPPPPPPIAVLRQEVVQRAVDIIVKLMGAQGQEGGSEEEEELVS